MQLEQFVGERVAYYYWNVDVNCATTMLLTLAELRGMQLQQQVIDSALGMHGAGCFGAQCGLVEGSLMAIGIFGREKGLPPETIVSACYRFAQQFEQQFGSLLCKELRPQGFRPDNPPHLCEEFTKKAVIFSAEYLNRHIK